MSASPAPARIPPEFVVLAGCVIALIGFGPRASAGLFQVPMTTEFGWGRDIFGLAIALQNLLWGLGQPFAGAVADRFGATRVLCAGALLYAHRPRRHGQCLDAGHAASRRRRADRLRPRRLLLQPRHRRLQQAPAGSLASARLRRRHRRRLLRPVPVSAVRQRPHRGVRLALDVDRLRGEHSPHPAAVDPFGDAPARARRRTGRACRASRSRRPCRKPSGTAATCSSSSASSPAGSSLPSSPCICRPI